MGKSKSEEPATRTARLRERVRTTGLRATIPRLEVLARLEVAKSPLSHANLAEELVPLGFDRATVYRNLNDLVEVGLASRVELGDHIGRFENRADSAQDDPEHPHFLCNDCGDVVCLPTLEIPMPRKTSSQIRDVQDVVLRGRCASC
ncbi:MAG: transcriptional repressor [Candidatus Binatia bacterium]|nr:transcriptional repressor [Candidatus Binatia bacterium]